MNADKNRVLYKFLIIRDIGGLVSQITQFHGVPASWSGIEIADWSTAMFGDLIDNNWMVLFKPADDQLANIEDDLV